MEMSGTLKKLYIASSMGYLPLESLLNGIKGTM
jgi:hypothetical protein